MQLVCSWARFSSFLFSSRSRRTGTLEVQMSFVGWNEQSKQEKVIVACNRFWFPPTAGPSPCSRCGIQPTTSMTMVVVSSRRTLVCKFLSGGFGRGKTAHLYGMVNFLQLSRQKSQWFALAFLDDQVGRVAIVADSFVGHGTSSYGSRQSVVVYMIYIR